ncbi:hypothetical protein GTW93_36305 [Streptomyces sp. SID5789]|nr:hypothetical protein [Streptomyces sp. SID5789]
MSGHQHSPCADGSPNLPGGGVVIAGSIATAGPGGQGFSGTPGRRPHGRSRGRPGAHIMCA